MRNGVHKMRIELIRPGFWGFVVITLLFLSAQGAGQSTQPPSIGGVPVPVRTGVLGKQDPIAMAELAAHFAAVGSVGWGGMQGTGTMTFDSEGATAYPATFSNLHGSMFRLDVQEQSKVLSIRIHGPVGKIRDGDGAAVTMPPETALAGLYPFGRFRRASVRSTSTSISDRGVSTVGGVQLHRISVEYASLGKSSSVGARETIVTDLYFDPTTHLLVQSASTEKASSGRQASFLIVVSYGDYRTVGTSLIPFRYTETIEGQLYSTLQLSSVELNPNLTSSFFDF